MRGIGKLVTWFDRHEDGLVTALCGLALTAIVGVFLWPHETPTPYLLSVVMLCVVTHLLVRRENRRYLRSRDATRVD